MNGVTFARRLNSLLTLLMATAGVASLYADSSSEPLFECLRHGDFTRVTAAIESGMDVNTHDERGNTLLMQAASYSTAAELGFLLTRGAEVNTANQAGHTAVIRAMPDLGKIKVLVEHGAGINVATVQGRTPLMIAAGIRTGAAVVQYLIGKGARLQAIDRSGLDAVHIAAQAGASGNLKLLLDAGADVHGRVQQPAMLFNRSGDEVSRSVVDRALRARRGATAVLDAADCELCVRMLLEHGADAKGATGSGMTPLHYAAYTGNSAIVKMLLETGAPVNVADERGLTPLMMGANSKSKDPDVVRLLLEHGGDPKARDTSGRSVSEWARVGLCSNRRHRVTPSVNWSAA